MQDPKDPIPQASRREPWNKGKLIGAKPPLRPKHVWSIRTKLQIAGRTRDLAMFNLAIDSKLRGCDVVSLRVEDVAPHGHAVDRATVRQKKTGQGRCVGRDGKVLVEFDGDKIWLGGHAVTCVEGSLKI